MQMEDPREGFPSQIKRQRLSIRSCGLACGSDTWRSSSYPGTMRTNANTQNGEIEKVGGARVLDDTLGPRRSKKLCAPLSATGVEEWSEASLRLPQSHGPCQRAGQWECLHRAPLLSTFPSPLPVQAPGATGQTRNGERKVSTKVNLELSS